MGRARLLWLMVSIGTLILRTSEARAAQHRSNGMHRDADADTGPPMNAMGPTSPSSQSNGPTDRRDETDTTMPPMMGPSPGPNAPGTPGTPGGLGIPGAPGAMGAPNAQGAPDVQGAPNAQGAPTTPTPNPPVSNDTSTSAANGTAKPYIDQYGNELPKVVNATQQNYSETTDMMEGLPVIPLDENNAYGGNNAWLVYRIPAAGAQPPAIQQPSQVENYVNYNGDGANGFPVSNWQAQQPAVFMQGQQSPAFVQAQQQPLFVPGQQPWTVIPAPQPQPFVQGEQQPPFMPGQQAQPFMQAQQPAFIVVARPVEAYQEDYYKVNSSSNASNAPTSKDNSSSNASSLMKDLDDFFHR